jgi:hypothetical protein
VASSAYACKRYSTIRQPSQAKVRCCCLLHDSRELFLSPIFLDSESFPLIWPMSLIVLDGVVYTDFKMPPPPVDKRFVLGVTLLM